MFLLAIRRVTERPPAPTAMTLAKGKRAVAAIRGLNRSADKIDRSFTRAAARVKP